jgi:hypothetical protein
MTLYRAQIFINQLHGNLHKIDTGALQDCYLIQITGAIACHRNQAAARLSIPFEFFLPFLDLFQPRRKSPMECFSPKGIYVFFNHMVEAEKQCS